MLSGRQALGLPLIKAHAHACWWSMDGEKEVHGGLVSIVLFIGTPINDQAFTMPSWALGPEKVVPSSLWWSITQVSLLYAPLTFICRMWHWCSFMVWVIGRRVRLHRDRLWARMRSFIFCHDIHLCQTCVISYIIFCFLLWYPLHTCFHSYVCDYSYHSGTPTWPSSLSAWVSLASVWVEIVLALAIKWARFLCLWDPNQVYQVYQVYQEACVLIG